MNLYYTNTVKQNAPNSSLTLSLGRYISTTPVSNGSINGIFSEISMYGESVGRPQYVCLGLKNTTGGTLDNITFNILKENEDDEWTSSFEVGFVKPNQKDEILYTQNVYSMPNGIEMIPMDGTINSLLNIGSLNDNEWIGLWISRNPNKSYFDKANNNMGIVKRWLSKQIIEYDQRVADGEPNGFCNAYIPNDLTLANINTNRELLRDIKQLPTVENIVLEIDWS